MYEYEYTVSHLAKVGDVKTTPVQHRGSKHTRHQLKLRKAKSVMMRKKT
jgi:hypothetical protein